jgi:hypothetical protein
VRSLIEGGITLTTRKRPILRRGWSFAAACMLVSVFALAAPAGAQAPPTCGEQAPTIVGTNGADLLVGTPGDDVIVGLGGRDVIVGKAGNDLLCGGRGSDLVPGTAVTISSPATTTSCWPWPSRGFRPATGATPSSATTAPTSLSGCPAATSSTAAAATTS